MFCPFSRETVGIKSEKCFEYGSSDSQIDKPQRGCPTRAELSDVNIKTHREPLMFGAKGYKAQTTQSSRL